VSALISALGISVYFDIADSERDFLESSDVDGDFLAELYDAVEKIPEYTVNRFFESLKMKPRRFIVDRNKLSALSVSDLDKVTECSDINYHNPKELQEAVKESLRNYSRIIDERTPVSSKRKPSYPPDNSVEVEMMIGLEEEL